MKSIILFSFCQKRPSYLLLNVILSSISFVLLVIFDVLFLIGSIYFAIAAKSEEDEKYSSVPLFYWLLVLLPLTCKLFFSYEQIVHDISECMLFKKICFQKFTVLAAYFWVVTLSIYKAVQELADRPPTAY